MEKAEHRHESIFQLGLEFMNSKTTTYHIIGGGIAGLAAAKFIKEKNIHNKVILYEAASKLGGRCFSFFDAKLDRTIDNATHVLLRANKKVLRLINNPQFFGLAKFYADGDISAKFWNFKEHIWLSVFNTQAEDVAPSLIRKLIWKLFPFLPYQLKIYFSKGDLTTSLVDPLSRYIDEIKLGHVLQGFMAEKKKVVSLDFNKEEIKIAAQDKIICALDSSNYAKIFDGEDFEYNEITNIFFRTSTELTLPKETLFLATPQNIADWIFINKDVVAATISDSGNIDEDDEELARKVWLEIREINGLKPAFLPPYRVTHYKQATIKQDEPNNCKRPKSAKTKFKNMRIAGDWTMRGWPCCLEAAVVSARRAVT